MEMGILTNKSKKKEGRKITTVDLWQQQKSNVYHSERLPQHLRFSTLHLGCTFFDSEFNDIRRAGTHRLIGILSQEL